MKETVGAPDLEAFGAFFLGDFEAASDDIERTGHIPPDLIHRTAQAGALGLTVPLSEGGSGLDVVKVLPYLEAASKGPAAGRMLTHVANGMWRPISAFGSPEQRRLVAAIAAGEATVAIAVTEREGGSGRDLRCSAEPTGRGWRLRGEKYLITFAGLADWAIVLAATDDRRAADSLSTFLVPMRQEGVAVQPDPMMGLAGIELGSISLDVEVPDEQRLGKQGEGFAVLSEFLNYSRISLSACMVGFAQRALDEAIGFAKRRVTFGKPIAERQAIQVHLADMYSHLAAARATVRDVATKSRDGREFAVDAAAAKLFCAEMVNGVADLCLQIHGGFGLTRASVAQRISRDARSFWAEEGTAEIQQLLIARQLLR